MIIIGLVPALVPVIYWLGAQILNHLSVGPVPFEQIVPILLPFSAMYAVMQYRLVDTDRVITQTWLYVALLALHTLQVTDRLRLDLPPEPRQLSSMRAMLRRWLAHAGWRKGVHRCGSRT